MVRENLAIKLCFSIYIYAIQQAISAEKNPLTVFLNKVIMCLTRQPIRKVMASRSGKIVS